MAAPLLQDLRSSLQLVRQHVHGHGHQFFQVKCFFSLAAWHGCFDILFLQEAALLGSNTVSQLRPDKTRSDHKCKRKLPGPWAWPVMLLQAAGMLPGHPHQAHAAVSKLQFAHCETLVPLAVALGLFQVGGTV
jgi:hypothetical protein